jgi:hypothetical protein
VIVSYLKEEVHKCNGTPLKILMKIPSFTAVEFSLCNKSELRTYTKVVLFQKKMFLSLCSIVTTTEWNGMIKTDN